MAKTTAKDLKKRTLMAVRDYGVQLAMFRNAMNKWAGFNATDMECLRLLFIKGTATPSEIARQTSLTSGATTAMLDRLERGGWIERQPNPDDRRGTLIMPVDSAADEVASWFESARNAQEKLVSSYSDRELELIADVFERFADLWNQERKKVQSQRVDSP